MICDILHIYNRCRCFFARKLSSRNQLKFRNFVKKLSLPVGHSSFKSMEWKNGVFFCLGGTSWDVEPCRWGFVSIISATQFVEQIMIRCSRFWIFDDECLFVNGSKIITELRSVVVSFGYQKPDLSWTGWRVSMDINSSRIWLLKSSDLYLPVLGRKNVG